MSAALLAMAIHDQGMHAAPDRLAGRHHHHRHPWKRPDHRHHPGRITSALDRNDIVIVAGFQGVAQDTKDVTTQDAAPPTPPRSRYRLTGRRSLRDLYRRRRCLYRRSANRAERSPHSEISYEEMMEMAACGAKILHLRCVEYARRENVRCMCVPHSPTRTVRGCKSRRKRAPCR